MTNSILKYSRFVRGGFRWGIAFLFAFCFKLSAFSQQSVLDIPSMHLLINESIDEHELQVKARDRQALASANEAANQTLLTKVKVKYRELQQRFNTLGTAIDVAEIGITVIPMVGRIVQYQRQILALAEKDPSLLPLAYQTEIDFVGKAKALAGYMAGLILSIGDVNQMKASDRKLLFDYVVSEVSTIQELSATLLGNLQHARLRDILKAANPFSGFINADLSVGKEILQNARYLK